MGEVSYSNTFKWETLRILCSVSCPENFYENSVRDFAKDILLVDLLGRIGREI